MKSRLFVKGKFLGTKEDKAEFVSGGKKNRFCLGFRLRSRVEDE